MKQVLVRYKTKPEATAENERLIKAVFEELQAESPQGLRYVALKLADGSFVHFAETGEAGNPLLEAAAFQAFQSDIKNRCIEPPQPNDATIVGNYRMLAE